MNNTSTTEWKSKLSPRARGRIQIALPTDDTTEFNVESASRKDEQALNLQKKQFAQTGTFSTPSQNMGLNFGSEKQRKTVYGPYKMPSPPAANRNDWDQNKHANDNTSSQVHQVSESNYFDPLHET